MKISELRSYRSHKKYKFTPLFWKLSVSMTLLVSFAIFAAIFDFSAPSISVASASDIETPQDHDLNMTSFSPSEDNLSASAVPTDTAIDEEIPDTGTMNVSVPPSSTSESALAAAPPAPTVPVNTTPPVDGLFGKTAFVGDSRTEGLLLYSGVKGATDYAIKGLNLKSVLSNAFAVSSSGSKVTILNDMKNRSFDKIYISFGLNELGWSNDTYAKKYTELVNKIKDVQPNANIYLQATFPINPDKCRFDQNTNKQIEQMNSQLEKIASTTANVYYVDLSAQFKDSRGFLIPEASSDGIHLNKKYCTLWLNGLENHLAGQSTPVPEPPQTTEQALTHDASESPVSTESDTPAPQEVKSE